MESPREPRSQPPPDELSDWHLIDDYGTSLTALNWREPERGNPDLDSGLSNYVYKTITMHWNIVIKTNSILTNFDAINSIYVHVTKGDHPGHSIVSMSLLGGLGSLPARVHVGSKG